MSRPAGPPVVRFLQRFVPPHKAFQWGISVYPPYLGAGVRCEHVSPDIRTVDVAMDLRFYNRNFVGTHFGGSLYTMADPFFMLILLFALGDTCVVWDKKAAIRFVRPGKGTVRAHFHVPDERIDAIRAELDGGARSVDAEFSVDIVDEQGKVVAIVDKTVYVRRKDVTSGG
jgi:acyl-coenzyme A thioesterase PaaI-like protein